MRNARRGMIQRLDDDEDDVSAPSPATTLGQADAALYGLIKADSKLREEKRTRFGAFRLTATGLEIIPGQSPRVEDWRDAGEFIFKMETGIQWMIGDWLAYGEDVKWGDIPEIAAKLGREYNTLKDFAYVARNVELSVRTDNLSFGHHKLVAGLDQERQRESLAYAIEHALSVTKFRKWLDVQQGKLPAYTLDRTPDFKLQSQLDDMFFKLLRQDKAEAEAYARQIQRWATAILEQHFKEDE